MQNLKRAYASAMQGFGTGLYGSGVLRRQTQRTRGDLTRWLHSLFAIYDINAMVGLDLPWWTLRAADLVDTFLAGRPQARIFEYGSGASTIFLARRATQVFSVEHDPEWHAVVSGKLAAFSNATLELVEAPPATAATSYWSAQPRWKGYDFQDYVQAIDRHDGSFDLIVIDGRCRSRCLQAANRRIKRDGIILFDNAGRRRYRAALEHSGLAGLPTGGLTACLPYPDKTVLLSPTPTTLTGLLER